MKLQMGLPFISISLCLVLIEKKMQLILHVFFHKACKIEK